MIRIWLRRSVLYCHVYILIILKCTIPVQLGTRSVSIHIKGCKYCKHWKLVIILFDGILDSCLTSVCFLFCLTVLFFFFSKCFRELERQAAQKRCHLSIRVLCDKQVVCRSRPLTLFPHFTTTLNQLFSLQISIWPQSLSLELTMEGGIGPGKRLTASVFVPVPPGLVIYLLLTQFSKTESFSRHRKMIQNM